MAIENTFHEASILLLLNSSKELRNTNVTWYILRFANIKKKRKCLRNGKSKGFHSNS